jgi:hypothetical protein
MEKIESHPYFNLPEYIEKLRGLRGDTEDYNINFNIIILSTIVVESVLFDLINVTIENTKPIDNLHQRILTDYQSKLNKASWNEINNVIEIIFGLKLNDCVDNELWKSIRVLFIYRNIITHGKPVIVENKEVEGKIIRQYIGKYKLVHDHLIEKNIVSQDRAAILNNDICDYFWTVTKDFTSAISKALSNDKNDIVRQMLEESLKRASAQQGV